MDYGNCVAGSETEHRAIQLSPFFFCLRLRRYRTALVVSTRRIILHIGRHWVLDFASFRYPIYSKISKYYRGFPKRATISFFTGFVSMRRHVITTISMLTPHDQSECDRRFLKARLHRSSTESTRESYIQ